MWIWMDRTSNNENYLEKVGNTASTFLFLLWENEIAAFQEIIWIDKNLLSLIGILGYWNIFEMLKTLRQTSCFLIIFFQNLQVEANTKAFTHARVINYNRVVEIFEFFAGFPAQFCRVPVRRVLWDWSPRLWEPVGKKRSTRNFWIFNGFLASWNSNFEPNTY